MSIGPRSFNASTVMPNISSNWQWANYELQNCTSSADLENNWETISGLSSEMDMDFRPPISSLAMEDIPPWAPGCVPNLSTEYEKMFEEAASRSRFVESNTILFENYQKLFDPAMIKQEINRAGSSVWDKSNESCSFTQLLTGHNANRLPPVLPSDSCNQAERLSDQSSVTHSGDQSDESANPQACNRNLVEDGSNYSPDQKRFLSNSGSEAKFKRPKTEQNSCFPLKVRKEKLGERISALQQLVSPFGKTDTASVLLEAIGYIKFLHEQVQVLSTPYMKGSCTRSRNHDSAKGGWIRDKDDPSLRADLRSRGLCLVPVTNSLQIANDNGADYWAPAVTSLQ